MSGVGVGDTDSDQEAAVHARTVRTIGGVAVAFIVTLFSTFGATAQEPDTTTTTVVDPSGSEACGQDIADDGRLPEKNFTRPQADELEAAGVDLHVRFRSEMLDRDLIDELQDECPRRFGAGRPDNSLLLVVAGSNQAGLWAGRDVRAKIGSRFADIRERAFAAHEDIDLQVATMLSEIRTILDAPSPPDPLACDVLVFDPAGRLGAERPLVEDRAATLEATGASVHVRVDDAAETDIDARYEQLKTQCDGWYADDDVRADQIVLSVQMDDRATGLWYGSDHGAKLAAHWESIQTDYMNDYFRRADVAGGVRSGLEQIADVMTGRYLDGHNGATPEDVFSDRGDSDTGVAWSDIDGGAAGSLFWLVLILFLGALGYVVQYLSWKTKSENGETRMTFAEYRSRNSGGEDDDSSWWRSRNNGRSYSSRRSSGGSSRSRGGGRSSGGSRSSSRGGGSGRSGGGSTRW